MLDHCLYIFSFFSFIYSVFCFDHFYVFYIEVIFRSRTRNTQNPISRHDDGKYYYYFYCNRQQVIKMNKMHWKIVVALAMESSI